MTMRMRDAFITILAALTLSACRGERVTAPAVPRTPAPLREIVIPRLPSPYYHFEYDAMGRPSRVSFASGLKAYDVTYDGDRIVEMRNNTLAGRDRVVYAYDAAGRVTTVRYVDQAARVYTTLSLGYDGQKLIRLVRARLLGDTFVTDKVTTFSYAADGNLHELTEHRPAIEGHQAATTGSDRFERYDDKVNVEAFSLLHTEFFDHLVLLPGVQLQRGNPGHINHAGTASTTTSTTRTRTTTRGVR
jgi:hypothetical protein